MDITKEDLLLGHDSETLIKNADNNFNALFDEVDSLGEAIAAGIDKNVNDLENYVLASKTGTSISLELNSDDYKMTLYLLNPAGTAISTKTIDFPLESVVVGASYDNTNKEVKLTLQNGNTTSFSVSDLVSGLVPDSRTINGKNLKNDITLTQDDVGDGTTYKRFSATDKAKLDKFSVNSEGNLTYDGNEIGKVKDVQVNGDTVLDESTGIANIVINVADLKGNYVENITPTAVTLNDKSYKAIVVEETDVTLEVLNSEGKAVVTQVIRANGNIYYCLPSTDENTYTLRKVGGNSVSEDISELEERVSNLEIGKRQFNFSCSVDNVTAYSDEIFTPTVIEMEDMTFDGKTGVDAFIAKRGYMLDNQEDPEEGYVFYHYSGVGVTKTYLDGGETKTIEIYAGYWKITDISYDIENVPNLPDRLTEDLGKVNIRGFFVYKSSNTKTDYNDLFSWLIHEFDFAAGEQNKKIENIGVRYCEYGSIPNMLTLRDITIPNRGINSSYVRFVYNNAKDDEFYFDISCTDIKTKVISIS